MNIFEKFNSPLRETADNPKSSIEKEALQFDPNLEKNPRFKEIVDKVHKLDELYNKVDETKRKLILSKFYEKCGWLFSALGSAEIVLLDGVNYGFRGGSAESAIHNAEVGTLSLALGLLVKFVGEKMTKQNREKNRNALDERIAYHISSSKGLNT